MAVTIEDEITGNLGGATAAALATYYDGEGSQADWDTLTDNAIARATLDAYGDVAAPATLPDLVAYWVADKATLYLIPSAIDYYQAEEHAATAAGDVSVREYDKVASLRDLRDSLRARCLENEAAVQAIVNPPSSTSYYRSVPGVSIDGLLVDPVSRARARGPQP